MRLVPLLEQCLDALNQEALADEHWNRPIEHCSSWYQLRAELRDLLKKLNNKRKYEYTNKAQRNHTI